MAACSTSGFEGTSELERGPTLKILECAPRVRTLDEVRVEEGTLQRQQRLPHRRSLQQLQTISLLPRVPPEGPLPIF